jgi:hypothetical protein
MKNDIFRPCVQHHAAQSCIFSVPEAANETCPGSDCRWLVQIFPCNFMQCPETVRRSRRTLCALYKHAGCHSGLKRVPKGFGSGENKANVELSEFSPVLATNNMTLSPCSLLISLKAAIGQHTCQETTTSLGEEKLVLPQTEWRMMWIILSSRKINTHRNL